MEFKELIEKRKSVRKYKDQEISKEILEELVDIMVQSPTAMNKQERLYTVIQDKEIMDRLAGAMGESLGRDGYNFMGAPCLILVSVPNEEIRGIQDSSIALTYLYLACTDLGLASCWINQFKEVDSEEYWKILSELHIPQDHKVYAGMVLGYPDEVPSDKVKSENANYII